MVVPFVNLPMHVFQAEHAAQSQIAQNAATTGAAAVVSERATEQAHDREARQVAEMDESEGLKVETETGSANSHTLAERKEEGKEEAPKDPPEGPPVPDPGGRGSVLDLSA